MKRVLIMGLPGAGKTTLASEMVSLLERAGKKVLWLNADKVRAMCNDWDFSEEGRLRQARRMRTTADAYPDCDYVLCDFVAPLPVMREIFDPHFTVWVDTVDTSRFVDTNSIFKAPVRWDVRVRTQDALYWAHEVSGKLLEL